MVTESVDTSSTECRASAFAGNGLVYRAGIPRTNNTAAEGVSLQHSTSKAGSSEEESKQSAIP